MKFNSESEIKSVETIHTGGNVYNDIITLKDGSVIAVSSEVITYYKSLQDYEDNGEIDGILRVED